MSFQPPLLEDKSVFLTVWDEAWAAISNPRMYVKWALQPLRRSVAYAAILLAVMAIVTTIYVWLTMRPQLQQIREAIVQQAPPFTITDGRLEIADGKTFTFSDNSDIFIRIDGTDNVEDLSIDPFYQFGAIVAADGVILRADGDVQTIKYDEFVKEDVSMDGAGLVAVLDRITTMVFVFLPFLVFAMLFLSYMAYTVFISAIVSLASGFRFAFRPVWNMSLYALTPFLLASHIFFIFYPNTFLPWLVYMAYMFMALYHYRRFLDLKAQIS